MEGEKLSGAKQGIQTHVEDNIEGSDFSGLLAFNSTPEKVYPLEHMKPQNRSEMLSRLRSIKASGKTALWDTLKKAIDMVDKKNKDQNGEFDEVKVVVATDGKDNSSSELKDVDEVIKYGESKDVEVKFLVIGIGDEVDEKSLGKLTTKTDGNYIPTGTSYGDVKDGFDRASKPGSTKAGTKYSDKIISMEDGILLEDVPFYPQMYEKYCLDAAVEMVVKHHYPDIDFTEGNFCTQDLFHRWFDTDLGKCVETVRNRIGLQTEVHNWNGRPIESEGSSGLIKTKSISSIEPKSNEWDDFWSRVQRKVPRTFRILGIQTEKVEKLIFHLWENLSNDRPVICIFPEPIVNTGYGSNTSRYKIERELEKQDLEDRPPLVPPDDLDSTPFPPFPIDGSNEAFSGSMDRFHSIVVVGIDPQNGIIVQDPNEFGEYKEKGFSYDGIEGIKYRLKRRIIPFERFLKKWSFLYLRSERRTFGQGSQENLPILTSIVIKRSSSNESRNKGYTIVRERKEKSVELKVETEKKRYEKPASKPSLEKEKDFTSENPEYFVLNGERIEVSSWSELLGEVLRKICKENKALKFERVLEIKGERGRKYFSTKKKDLQRPKKISGFPYFYEAKISANDILGTVKKLLNIFDYSYESDFELGLK